MAKVEADKTLITPTPISTFVPTPSYRRTTFTPKAGTYADLLPTKSEEDNLKMEIKNAIVHEIAKTLYGSNILIQTITVSGKEYKLNYHLIQLPKAVIHISAWQDGEQITVVSIS